MFTRGGCVLFLLIVCLFQPVLAQETLHLDETFQNADFDYQFNYPSDWEFVGFDEEVETMLILRNAAGSEIYIEAFALKETAAEFMQLIIEQVEEDVTADEPVVISLEYGEAHRNQFSHDEWDETLILFLREIEYKTFMVRGFERTGDTGVEATLLAILNTLRLVPGETELPSSFFERDIAFTFEYPENWLTGITQGITRLNGGGRSLGMVQLITPGREFITLQVYEDTTPEEALKIVDDQSAALNLTKVRETPLILDDYRGVFVIYDAPFFQQRLVYLMAQGENTVRLEIVAGITDDVPGYMKLLRAMLLTVQTGT